MRPGTERSSVVGWGRRGAEARGVGVWAVGAWVAGIAGCAPDQADTGDSWLPSEAAAETEWSAAREALDAGGAVELSMRAADVRALAGLELLGADPARAGWARAIARDPATLAEAMARGAGRLRPMTGDTTPPSGTVEINAGAAWARSASVTLAIAATDDDAVTEMCVSNTATCTRWEGYATSLSWSIGGGAGAKTVNVWFRDASGNVSSVASDSISLDMVVPTNGSVAATPSAGQVELAWSGYADTLSGISSYKVMYAIGTATPGASCRTGTLAYEGADSSVVLTGLGDGTTYNYIVCALDAAGNASTGTRVTTRPAPEFNPPTGGSVEINGGATWTNRAQVTLELSASDDTAVSQMCVTSRATCTSWIAYQTPYTFTIAGTGDKTVSVWFRDTYNNVTTAPATDSIIVDTARPVNGAVSTSGASGEVTVAWSGYSDAGSGIASYRVMRSTGTLAPTNCTTGAPIYDGPDSSYLDTGLTDGTTYAYRVCAVDNAGNVSQGRTTTGRPAPEYNAPTGALSINAGAAYARTGTATLTISASDDSDVTHMCVSNTPRCTTWIAFSETKPWSLSGSGLKTVYLKLRDQYGNVSATTISDTITLDPRGPTGGALAATAGSGTEIDLVGSGFTDALSGVASYKVVYAAGSRAPASCATGTVGYTGTAAEATVSGLSANTLYSLRMCGIDAVGNVGTGVTASATTLAEGDPPTDTSVLLDGGELYSLDGAVDVTLSASDASGVSLMCLSDTEECPEWLPYETDTAWSFAEVEGTHTLYAWFEDGLGNATSEATTANILIDWTAPADGEVSATQDGDGAVELSWGGFSDDGSGIDFYRVLHHADGHLPTACDDGDIAYSGSDTAVTLSSLTNEIEHHFLVCAYDMLGTASTGASASVFLYDTTPPTPVGLTINSGGAYTNNSTVTVTAEATDGGGMGEVCLSHTDEPCADWQPYGAPLSWDLEPGEGERTVYAYFRDLTGNVSETSASASVQVDQTLPTDGAISLEAADGEVYAEWSGFADEAGGSGLAAYWLVYAEGTSAPADCDSGEVAYTGADESVTVSGLTNGTQYSFRLCAEDGAGNLSAGVTAAARPAPEFLPPEGTILIDGDIATIGTGSVAIDLSAADDSTVSLMCLSEDPDACVDWVAYDTVSSWTFPAVEGTHTLYAWFEDEWYNTTTAAVSDDVYMDATAPTDGSAAASAAGDNGATVSWSGFSDDTAGVASYKVVYASTGAPADCNSGTTGYTGTATSATLSGLRGGTAYTFRVCAIDAVGNMSAGTTATATTPDTTRPTGTVSINSGAIGTRTTAVTLTITPVDDSPIATMCVSNTSACTTYVAYTATKAHTLVSATAGVKTVYVYLRDASGNTSLAITDTIIMDTTAPANGVVTVTTTTPGQIGLSWTRFTDTGSGIASYKVVYAVGTTAPANCTTAGTTLYAGTSTSVTHTGLTTGAKYSYRICAIDNATNTSTGAAKANNTVR